MEVAQPAKTADRVNALLLHVRSNPGEHSPSELAAQFDVPESLVREIVAQRKKAPRPLRVEPKSSPVTQSLVKAINWVDTAFDRLISSPALFIILSTIVAVVTVAVLRSFMGPVVETEAAAQSKTVSQPGSISFGLSWRASSTLAVVIGFVALHMVALFRFRRSRYAILAGALVFVIFLFFGFTNPEPIKMPDGQELGQAQSLVLIIIGCFAMGMLYAGLGSMVAVAGGWLHMTSEERRFRSMSRLEMLERYFQIEEALEASPSLGESTGRAEIPILRSIKKHTPIWSAATGFVGVLLTIAFMSLFGVDPSLNQGPPPVGYLIASIGLSFTTMLAYGFLVWHAGSIPRAMLVSLVYQVVGTLTYYIPVAYPGRESLLARFEPHILLLTFAGYTVMGAVIGLGAKVAKHAKSQAGVKSGDPTALVRELVRLEERLMVDTGRVCVMSVDVAGSTKMKAGADPMDAEYSFAAYQAWVSEVCRRKAGRVHSTAGDGAIVSFGDARSAFEAGCILQVGVAWLNQERNRLATPFRLRVGLHEGEVAADLDKLQFTRVIDVAAHVESVSPIGGLAVTEEVAGQLSDVPWVVLPELMDGHRVFTLGSDLVPNFGGLESEIKPAHIGNKL